MASTYLTKAQRKALIEEYLDCQEEVGGDATFASLNSLGNVELINECKAMMPDCLD
jgi:hypothetical protein